MMFHCLRKTPGALWSTKILQEEILSYISCSGDGACWVHNLIERPYPKQDIIYVFRDPTLYCKYVCNYPGYPFHPRVS